METRSKRSTSRLMPPRCGSTWPRLSPTCVRYLRSVPPFPTTCRRFVSVSNLTVLPIQIPEPKLDAEAPTLSDLPLLPSSPSSGSSNEGRIQGEPCGTQDGALTSREKLMIINGVIRPKNLGFKGNPDLQPIRSYECTFLVRQLYVLSCLINAKVCLQGLFTKTWNRLHHIQNALHLTPIK